MTMQDKRLHLPSPLWWYQLLVIEDEARGLIGKYAVSYVNSELAYGECQSINSNVWSGNLLPSLDKDLSKVFT